MAEFTGVRTSANSETETRQVRIVADRIFLYAPQYTPILMLKGGIMPGPNGERIKVKGLIKSEFAPGKKVEWFEKTLPSVTAYAAETLAASASSTSFHIDNASGAAMYGVKAGAILMYGAERLFVTAYNTSTLVATVVRGVGSTSPIEIPNDEALKILGYAVKENSATGTGRGVEASPYYNYQQIFRNDWAVSRSADKIRTYGGKDKAETMSEAAVEHVREIEQTWMFGYKSNNLTDADGHVVQTMGGFMEFNDGVYGASTNTGRFLTTYAAHGGTINYGEMVETFLVESFKYSSPRRRKMFVGGSVWGKIFGRFSTDVGNIQTYVRDTAFGVNVTEVISPAGAIEFLTSGSIEECATGTAFCFDPEFVTFSYVDNTFMVENAQAKGTDGYAGYLLTEGTLKFEAQKTITALTGVTGWVKES